MEDTGIVVDPIVPNADATMPPAPAEPLPPQPKSARCLSWSNFKRLKTIVEFIAILIAGLWAGTRYYYDERPGLVERGDLKGDLRWEKVSDDLCRAIYHVEFRNIGKVKIDVTKVRLSASYIDLPKMADPVKLLDPSAAKEEDVHEIWTEDDTPRLRGTYDPDVTDSEDFTFLVKNEKEKNIRFKVELWGGNESSGPWNDWHWDPVCHISEAK